MIVAIHQPQFLPWLGYIDKVRRADAFVFLDTVQFKKNEFQNRNRIRGPRGPQWVTVPVHHRFPTCIAEVRVARRLPWRRKLRGALQACYARAPHFEEVMEGLAPLWEEDWEGLAEVCVRSVDVLLRLFGIPTPLARASSLAAREEPTGRLVDLCRALRATTYLSGEGGREYLDAEEFRGAGIRVLFQQFLHPVYPQGGGPFLSHLSAVDLLMHCGPTSLDVLADAQRNIA